MTIEVAARLRGARVSAQKARLVADQVRGLKVDRALNVLEFSPKKAARIVKKVLESAIANAENNNNLSADSLIVKNAIVEMGPVLKRFKAGAKGSAMPRRKKMAHIRIILTDGKDNN